MGLYVFKLPDLGEGAAEAEIVAWRVAQGEQIEEDAPLVDVMTDKATMEITSPVRGRVLSLKAEPGQSAAVGSPIVEIEVEDEAAEELGEAVREVRPGPAEPPLKTERPDKGPPAGRAAAALAAPAVRRRAKALGVELTEIEGSGPEGRVVHEDLDALIARRAPPPAPQTRPALPPGPLERAPAEGVKDVKIMGLRRRIAEKMQAAKRRIPHFGYVEEVDVTELEALREHLNAEHAGSRPKLTLLPFLVRAVVRALARHPQMNALYDDEAQVLHCHRAVHMGVACQTAHGLMVPVVRNAEARDLWDLAAEISRLASAAREGRATREELSGSTITVTSLGRLGGISHFPVINHPEVAILGPNKIVERPVVREGRIVVRKMMNISSAFDHRVVDGADAAEFIAAIKAMLEQPARLFVD
jgi:2-oxoisovalerate dehydrogenase E2 component (dihydrolipoyl transacylase)